MNRPTLPYAISSATADRLPDATHDRAGIVATIADLLHSYDRANEATVQLPTASALQPVNGRYHVNPAKLSPARALIRASA